MTTVRLRGLEQQAWGGFLVAHMRLRRALETSLCSLDVSIAECEVLEVLDDHAGTGIRMSDLANRCQMSGGGLTRLVDRLEARGWIERRRSPADGRILVAALTGEGRALLQRAQARHQQDLRRLFFERLDGDDLRSLAQTWATLDPRSGACGALPVASPRPPGRAAGRSPESPPAPAAPEADAWSGLAVTHSRLWRALGRGLERVDLSMPEYDVLAQVRAAGPGGLRMTALAERLLMSTGGFTRLVDRLERRGLVQRRRSTRDGRVFDVVLARDGRATLRRARRQHHEDLRRLFFDKLNDHQLRRLADIWLKLDPANSIWTHLGKDASPKAEDVPSGETEARRSTTPCQPPCSQPARCRP